jgi:hypothetical protein
VIVIDGLMENERNLMGEVRGVDGVVAGSEE